MIRKRGLRLRLCREQLGRSICVSVGVSSERYEGVLRWRE
jgi:hypothetical protein